jgi:hypothetical protein
MPSGYSTIGTVIKLAGTPFAVASEIKYPEISTVVTDSTVLTSTWKTNIPSKLIEAKPFDVVGVTTPTALATMLALMVAGTAQAVEIDFTDGDALTFSAQITALKPGGAAIGTPATEKFTMTLTPTGAITAAAATGFWYTPVDSITVAGGDFGITSGTSPKTLVPIAICSGSGFAFTPPTADLTWTSATTAKMTIGANTGIVTFVATGTSIITVKITAKAAVQSEVLGTAS